MSRSRTSDPGISRKRDRPAGSLTAFRPLKPPTNLTSSLVERLRDEITSGRLSPGSRLPTEQEMMASFGISRTVIREAVAALRADGLVITRQGSGAFVAGDNARRPFRIEPERLSSIADVLQVMELRTSVEIEAAGLAAQRHDRAGLRGIETALEAIERQIAAGDAAVSADFEFHLAIAAATGNPYFVRFLDFLGAIIIPRQSVRIEAHRGSEQRSYLERVQAEHREIYAAIKDGAVGTARQAARRHLLNSRKRYEAMFQRIESQAGATT